MMLQALMTQYGLAALGLLIFLESAGLPLPGETMLLLAAAAAAQGILPIAAVILVAASAAIIGDSLGYWIGHRYGLALIARYGRWLRLTPTHVAHGQQFFQRHGAKTVFLGRFVALLRVLAAILAGASQMPYAQFLVYNALGGIVWAAFVGGLGFLFGGQLPLLETWLRQIGWGLAGVVVAGLIGVITWRWLVRHQMVVRDWLDRIRQRMARSWLARIMDRWRERLSLWSYLGVHTSIGLVVSIASLLGFAQIADSALGQEALAAIDLRLALDLHQIATPLTTQLMRFVTALGGPVVVVIALAGMAALIAWRRWADLILWIGAIGGGSILTIVLKALIQRPRPAFASPIDVEASWSFPSGHALMAMVTYGLVAYLLIVRLHQWRWQVALALASLFLIALIGLSRLYLGVHYLSDVLAGYAAGMCWLATCLSAWAYRATPPPGCACNLALNTVRRE
jgi:undecaprenyl-diphosphatase